MLIVETKREGGLVRRVCLPAPVERRHLGRSVWLLLLLIEWMTPGDPNVRGGDSIRAEEIAEALRVGERQARRDLQRLRRAGYVELQNTGRGFRIRLVSPSDPGRDRVEAELSHAETARD